MERASYIGFEAFWSETRSYKFPNLARKFIPITLVIIASSQGSPGCLFVPPLFLFILKSARVPRWVGFAKDPTSSLQASFVGRGQAEVRSGSEAESERPKYGKVMIGNPRKIMENVRKSGKS